MSAAPQSGVLILVPHRPAPHATRALQKAGDAASFNYRASATWTNCGRFVGFSSALSTENLILWRKRLRSYRTACSRLSCRNSASSYFGIEISPSTCRTRLCLDARTLHVLSAGYDVWEALVSPGRY